MPARAAILIAVMVGGTPAAARTRPTLDVDVARLIDEAVTLSGDAERQHRRPITEPVASPPVSLWETTRGLVSGGTPAEERQVAIELERAYRALKAVDDRQLQVRR